MTMLLSVQLQRPSSCAYNMAVETWVTGQACTHLGLALDALFAAERRLVSLLFFLWRLVQALGSAHARGCFRTQRGLRVIAIHCAGRRAPKGRPRASLVHQVKSN